jgi:hypothetical protein
MIKPDKKFTKTYNVQCIDLEPNILYIYSERQQPKLLLLFTTHQPLFCFWLTIPWHYSVSLFQSVPIISNHTGNSVKEILHCFAKSFHNLTYFAKQCMFTYYDLEQQNPVQFSGRRVLFKNAQNTYNVF